MRILSSKTTWTLVGVLVLCAVSFVVGTLVGWDKAIADEVVPIVSENKERLATLDKEIQELTAQVEQLQQIQEALSENTLVGVASWYGIGDGCGLVTATGERFNVNKFGVAHKTLPLGTYVLVKNLVTGKQAFGIINDRGPYIKGRDWDLTYGMAEYLGFTKAGLTKVQVLILGRKQG